MNHIEFVGPPGVGKSTLHSALVDGSRWYQPRPVPAGRRRFLDTASPRYRLVYRSLPPGPRSLLESVAFTDRYQREALEHFADRHPDAMQVVAAGIGAVEDDPGSLLRVLRRAIERYQLGVETVRHEETLCLDESFVMGAISILERKPMDEFSLESYLQHTPTPKVLIHVTAPPEICLERQHERGRIGLPEPSPDETLSDVQSNVQSLCAAVADQERSRTRVLSVENTGTIENAVERIESMLADELSDGHAGIEQQEPAAPKGGS